MQEIVLPVFSLHDLLAKLAAGMHVDITIKLAHIFVQVRTSV